MRVLIDENMDEEFPRLLPGFECTHVAAMGWKGLKNGELLDALQMHGFQVLVTVDKQMRYQQNIRSRPFSVVVLDIHPTGIQNQGACVPLLADLLRTVKEGEIYTISGPGSKGQPK